MTQHSPHPVSRNWGFDRGKPVDRYYIESFLASNSSLIQGHVLEVKNSAYTLTYGSNAAQSHVLSLTPSPEATIIGDLATGVNIPQQAFDCFILTQTLHLIFDIKSALRNSLKALKPGGTLLLTVPGISKVSRYDMDRWGDYWRFTDKTIKVLLEEIIPKEHFTVQNYGNVATAKAFLDGLAAHEIPEHILNYRDDDYQVIISAMVQKPII